MAQDEVRLGAVRTIQDPNGAHWRVWEVPDMDERRARPSLIFESEAVIRRVRDYPANWSELSDEELYAASLRR